jgi:hypothetical protein
MLVVLHCKFKFSSEVKPDPIALDFGLDRRDGEKTKKSKQIRSVPRSPDLIVPAEKKIAKELAHVLYQLFRPRQIGSWPVKKKGASPCVPTRLRGDSVWGRARLARAPCLALVHSPQWAGPFGTRSRDWSLVRRAQVIARSDRKKNRGYRPAFNRAWIAGSTGVSGSLLSGPAHLPSSRSPQRARAQSQSGVERPRAKDVWGLVAIGQASPRACVFCVSHPPLSALLFCFSLHRILADY